MQQNRCIIDLDTDFMTSSQANVISLKELCANKLVSHGVLTTAICRKLPQHFINLLFQSAVECYCNTSVIALLNAWRQEVFIFDLPDCLKRWEAFVCQHITTIRYKLLEKRYFVPLIIKHVIDLLAADCENECQIRCLDFSSFTVEGFLLHSVYRFLIEKCGMFPQRENGSPVKKKRCSKQNPLNKFVIKINVIVNVERDLSLLCETLNHLKDDNTNTALNVQVTGMHFSALKISISMTVLELLNLIEPETFNAFSCCLTFSPDYVQHDFELIQKLRNFPNLQTLNFELEPYDCGYHGRILSELSGLFYHLKNLKNLTINNFDYTRLIGISEFRMDQSFPSQLSFLSERLESLMLTGCRISADDFKYYSVFPQALALKTLSITDSNVDLQSLMSLLTLCKNLIDLCLARCEFSGGNIDLLFEAFPTMEKLEYLNMKDMKMSSNDLMSKAEYISFMPSLKYLSISPVQSLRKGVSSYSFEKRFHHALEMVWNCTSRNFSVVV